MSTNATNERRTYTDAEYVLGLKQNDNRVTYQFFYAEIASVLKDIQFSLFAGRVEYDELVNELYLYLQRDNWRKLDTFMGLNDAHIRTWINTVSWRYFFNIREKIQEKSSQEAVIEASKNNESCDINMDISMDVAKILATMKNERYSEVLVLMLIEGYSAEELARKWNTSVDNVYNIKHRTIKKFINLYGGTRKSKKTNKKK